MLIDLCRATRAEAGDFVRERDGPVTSWRASLAALGAKFPGAPLSTIAAKVTETSIPG